MQQNAEVILNDEFEATVRAVLGKNEDALYTCRPEDSPLRSITTFRAKATGSASHPI